ncbi:DUF349 domain-containing protein [Marinicellulosiphila megalodicopiae]|uniref:DUF349 domain-containing protein n=1 Tax=Marinicellulosiphila megalodicopiae TaxID=2724896 RepID=UPI003BB04D68
MIFSLFRKRKTAKDTPAKKAPVIKEVSINDIDNSEELFSKLIHASSTQQEKQLCLRIVTLCNEDKISISDIKQNISQIDRLLQIGLLLDNKEALTQLCPNANEKLFLQFAQEGLTAKSRTHAFNQLTDIKSFETLLSATKGKDKTIYRAAQEKVNLHTQAEQALLEIQNQVAHNLESLTKLASSTYAPQFEAKLELLIQTWQQYIDHSDARFHPSTSQLEQFEQAKLICENTIFELEEKQTAKQDKQTQQPVELVIEEVETLDNEKETQLVETCKNACLDLLDNQNDEAFEALQHLFVDTLKENLSESAVKQLQRLQNFAEAENTLSRLVSKFVEQNINESQASAELETWFKSLPAEIKQSNHESIVKAQHAIFERKKAFKEQKAEQKAAIDELFNLFRRGFSAINNGQVRRSAGINKGIEDQLEKIDLDKAPAMLNKKLEEFNEKLAKLQDWHEYATEPKKLELIAKMEKLINCGINPELLANKVKDLQTQWKQLSQGSSDKHQELWEQFNEHAQKAYAPCKSFFDEVGQLRKTNLEKREQMVLQLQEYIAGMNWSGADFKQVIKLLRAAKEQWQSYSPVERSASQKVQKQFNECIQNIQKQLDVEFADNQLIKENLIKKAEEAITIENARESVETIKSLQQQWKNVGLIERKTEQKLWEEFRKNCDAVFEKRNAQSKEFKKQLQDNLNAANEICDKLEALLAADTLDLNVAEALQEEYKQVGMIPKPSIETTQNRFRAAADAIIKKNRQLRLSKQEEKWINLEKLAKDVEACEEAWLNESSYDHLKEQLQQDSNNIQNLPYDIIGFQSRVDRVLENSITEIDHCASTLNEICIRMEILANIESPTAEQALRMHLQVERLKNDFGQSDTVREQLDELTRQWYSLGPISDEVRAPLKERFKICRDTIIE